MLNDIVVSFLCLDQPWSTSGQLVRCGQKGSCWSAKCTLTTAKSRVTFCCLVHKIKIWRKFKKVGTCFKILSNLKFQTQHTMNRNSHSGLQSCEINKCDSLHTFIFLLECMVKFGCQATNWQTSNLFQGPRSCSPLMESIDEVTVILIFCY